MTDSTVNYTPEMVATLEAAQPIDYAKAQLLAKQLDRGVRSIIAKTCLLYTSPSPRDIGPSRMPSSA